MSAAPNSRHPIELTGNDLTFAQLYDVAFRGEKVSLAPDAIERMKASRAVVERVVASGETAYGINTGFGKLASVRISAEQVRQLQVNLVRSHSCGVGAAAERSGNARDDAAACQCAGERTERHSPTNRGNSVRDAECESAPGDSVARLGGRFGRSCSARASGAGGDWRRARFVSRGDSGGRRSHAAGRHYSRRAGSEGRLVAAQRHAGHAGAVESGVVRGGCCGGHRGCGGGTVARRAARKSRRVRRAHHARASVRRSGGDGAESGAPERGQPDSRIASPRGERSARAGCV